MNIARTAAALISILRANLHKSYRKPLSVYYLITYRCPFSCEYCNITKNVPAYRELTTSEAISIIGQMSAAGTVKLQLTGGEPLMREDIGEIIDHSKKLGLFTGISTSGYKLGDNIDAVKKCDVVFLSLEGEKDVHEEIRGKGSYEVFKDAVKILSKEKVRFWTTTVINKKSAGQIEYIVEWAKRDGFLANFVMLHSRDADYSSCFANKEQAGEYYLEDARYEVIIRKLISLKKKHYPIGTSRAYLEQLLAWKNNKNPYADEGLSSNCWAGRLYGFLEPDGTLYPCGMLHDKMKGVSVLDYGVEKAFNELEKPFCGKCLSGCHSEQNMMFSFDLGVIKNWLTGLAK